MKVIWEYLSKADKRYMLEQVSLVELFQELHRRANQDVEEDEEVDWEAELFELYYQRFFREFPHLFRERRMA